MPDNQTSSPVMSESCETCASVMLIKPFTVSVVGYGDGQFFAASRSKALADAWRCDAFNAVSFKNFMKMARVRKGDTPPRFGEPIKVSGKPAYLVEIGHRVRFAYPGSDVVLNSHPHDVEFCGEHILANADGRVG